MSTILVSGVVASGGLDSDRGPVHMIAADISYHSAAAHDDLSVGGLAAMGVGSAIAALAADRISPINMAAIATVLFMITRVLKGNAPRHQA